jgi:hypothetical protein
MPNLGAGVDQHVNLTYTPTWLFTPTTGVINTVRIYNEGSNTIYVGGKSVTQNTGIPVPPGNKPLEWANATSALYAVSAVNVGAVMNTVGGSLLLTNVISVGASSVTTTAAVTNTLIPGTIFGIGNISTGSNLEFTTVATSVSTTVMTATVAFSHVQGEGIYPVTPTYGQVRVTAGVV